MALDPGRASMPRDAACVPHDVFVVLFVAFCVVLLLPLLALTGSAAVGVLPAVGVIAVVSMGRSRRRSAARFE
jgi:hypothetical protein